MTSLYNIQKLWAREGQRAAQQQLKKARLLVDRSGVVRETWLGRFLGLSLARSRK